MEASLSNTSVDVKVCSRCGKPGAFNKNRANADGLDSWCRTCRKVTNAEYYAKNPEKYLARTKSYRTTFQDKHPEACMWRLARRRARERELAFDIEPADIVIPATCPLLGIELLRSKEYAKDNSPSLDRRDPRYGYVKGNVWVISYRANRMKSDASIEELELLLKNLRAALSP